MLLLLNMAKNPWKKLLGNVMISATYGSHGARSKTNPKFSGREYFKNAANSSQSTKRHLVTITAADLERQFNKQRKKCYWFGIELNPLDIFTVRYPLAMSVDRIDNTKGYIKNNILITCRLANLGRQNCSPDVFKEVIKKLLNKI
jgi:hypothetical protein